MPAGKKMSKIQARKGISIITYGYAVSCATAMAGICKNRNSDEKVCTQKGGFQARQQDGEEKPPGEHAGHSIPGGLKWGSKALIQSNPDLLFYLLEKGVGM